MVTCKTQILRALKKRKKATKVIAKRKTKTKDKEKKRNTPHLPFHCQREISLERTCSFDHRTRAWDPRAADHWQRPFGQWSRDSACEASSRGESWHRNDECRSLANAQPGNGSRTVIFPFQTCHELADAVAGEDQWREGHDLDLDRCREVAQVNQNCRAKAYQTLHANVFTPFSSAHSRRLESRERQNQTDPVRPRQQKSAAGSSGAATAVRPKSKPFPLIYGSLITADGKQRQDAPFWHSQRWRRERDFTEHYQFLISCLLRCACSSHLCELYTCVSTAWRCRPSSFTLVRPRKLVAARKMHMPTDIMR